MKLKIKLHCFTALGLSP